MPLHEQVVQGAVSAQLEDFVMAALDLKLWFVGICFLASMISRHQSSINQMEVDVGHAAGTETAYIECLKSQSGSPCGSDGVGPARISSRRGGVEINYRRRSGGA